MTRGFVDADFETLRAVCRRAHADRSRKAGRVPTSATCACGAPDVDQDPACAALGALWSAYSGTEIAPPVDEVVFDLAAMRVQVGTRVYSLEDDWTTEVYDGDVCIGKLELSRGFGIACAPKGATDALRARWQADVDAMIRALRPPRDDSEECICRPNDAREPYEGRAYGFVVRLARLHERPGWRWHVTRSGDANSVGRGVFAEMDWPDALRTVRSVAWGFAAARHDHTEERS